MFGDAALIFMLRAEHRGRILPSPAAHAGGSAQGTGGFWVPALTHSTPSSFSQGCSQTLLCPTFFVTLKSSLVFNRTVPENLPKL